MIAFLPLLVLTACGLAGAEHGDVVPSTPGDARAARVEVVAVGGSTAEVAVTLPGEVLGARDVVLAAGNGGYVESLDVRRGEVVRKGQRIARIDAALFGAQLAQAEAQARQAESELARQEQLGDLAAKSVVDATRTQVAVAQAAEQQARARLARAAITAPFAGTVADTFVDAGEHAGMGSPVARLVELDPVRVMLSVADRDVVTLVEGLPVEVSTNARAGLYAGTITHVGPAADLRTRSFPVEVTVPNPDQALLPGMIAQVRVRRQVAEDAVVIPQDWLVTRRSEQGVFLDEEGVARWRTVALGEVAGDQVVISEGLAVGERLVVTGHRDLADGDALLVVRSGRCCTDGRATWGGE